MRDWSNYIDTDLGRRDQRHAFLWAVFLSLLFAIGYLLRWMLWNTPPLALDMILGCIALGAALFVVVGTKMTVRLIGAVEPLHYSHRPFQQRAILVRYVRRFGIPPSLRQTALPGLAALGIAVAALWVWAQRQESSWILIGTTVLALLYFLVAWLIVGAIFVLGSERAASGIAGFLFLTLDPRASAEEREAMERGFRRSAEGSWLGEVFLGLHDASRAPSSSSSAETSWLGSLVRIARWMTGVFFDYGLLAGAIMALALTMSLGEHGIDARSVAAYIAIVALTLTALASGSLGTFLYSNRSRELIEELRQRAFVDAPDDAAMLDDYLLVHTAIDFNLHGGQTLSDLRQALLPLPADGEPVEPDREDKRNGGMTDGTPA